MNFLSFNMFWASTFHFKSHLSLRDLISKNFPFIFNISRVSVFFFFFYSLTVTHRNQISSPPRIRNNKRKKRPVVWVTATWSRRGRHPSWMDVSHRCCAWYPREISTAWSAKRRNVKHSRKRTVANTIHVRPSITLLSVISFVAVLRADRAFSEFILSMKIRPHNHADRPTGHA